MYVPSLSAGARLLTITKPRLGGAGLDARENGNPAKTATVAVHVAAMVGRQRWRRRQRYRQAAKHHRHADQEKSGGGGGGSGSGGGDPIGHHMHVI